MKLYYAPQACSLAPHIVLRELKLPFVLIRVDNRSKRTASGEDFMAINPKGYVAALQLDNGAVLTEGPVILQYLADLQPQSGLSPAPGSFERLRLQEWLNFVSSEIHGGLGALFDGRLPAEVIKEKLFSVLPCWSRCWSSRSICCRAASAWRMHCCLWCCVGPGCLTLTWRSGRRWRGFRRGLNSGRP